ncbi:MAG TPA: thermonuclease family protein [Nitrospiria bacterium]
MAAEAGGSQERGLRVARRFRRDLTGALALWIALALGGSVSLGISNPGSVAEYAPPYSGKTVAVKRVIDGDTIELADGEMVRYLGLDAPELRRRVGGRWVKAPQPYALEALEFNRKLVSGQAVRLELDREVRDRFHRLLAYVYVDQRMINAELVASGYAVARNYPPNLRYKDLFIKLQSEAQAGHRGLWSGNKSR